MSIEIDKICVALDKFATIKPGISIPVSSITYMSDEEKNAVLVFLQFFGVIKISGAEFTIPSESAVLFIKSLSAYMRQGNTLVSVWDNRNHSDTIINETNVFISSNFLSLVEKARKEACSNYANFKPIFDGKTVRAVFVRRIWGRNHYLVQYSESVGQYQLIGGLFHHGDSDEKDAMIRKIREELPQCASKISRKSIEEIFVSQRTDEEVFFSKKYGVYARYKTYIYWVKFNEPVTKSELRSISKHIGNKWVTLREIEAGVTKDKKEIFKLAPNAIAQIKELEPNIHVMQHSIRELLEETWVKVTLALAGLFSFWPLIKILVAWIKSVLGRGA